MIIWVVVEETVFRRFGTYPIYEEHNLFPIEILIRWVASAIPMVIGIGLGLSKHKRVATDKPEGG